MDEIPEKLTKIPDHQQVNLLENYPEIPNNIVYPVELNQYLRSQTQYLTHENEALKRNLTTKETDCQELENQIRQIQRKLTQYETTKSEGLASYGGTQVASTKIVELSKKLREKNAEVAMLKTKCSKFEHAACEMKKQLDQTQTESSTTLSVPVVPQDAAPSVSDADELKKAQDKIAGLKTKLAESNNVILQLKNDLKMAKRTIQLEVGENVDLTGNWRGRAQIICDLQQKNVDLKEKLKTQVVTEREGGDLIQCKSTMQIRLDALAKENAELRFTLEETRKRTDALKVRNKTLGMEQNVAKSKCDMLKEQSERDQEVITTLSSQISNYKQLRADLSKQKEASMNYLRTENTSLKDKLKKLECILENMTKDLQKKDETIQQYNAKIFPPTLSHQPATTETNHLLVEQKHLLDLLQTANKRLEDERESCAKIQNQLRFEKQRAAKLEGSLARLELNNGTSLQSGSYSTMVGSNRTVSECSLRDQLELAEENLKAMRTRLEIEQMERQADLVEFGKVLEMGAAQ